MNKYFMLTNNNFKHSLSVDVYQQYDHNNQEQPCYNSKDDYQNCVEF